MAGSISDFRIVAVTMPSERCLAIFLCEKSNNLKHVMQPKVIHLGSVKYNSLLGTAFKESQTSPGGFKNR